LTSNVNVEPEAEQPGADPHPTGTDGMVLNWRLISVIERGVENDVIRSAKPF